MQRVPDLPWPADLYSAAVTRSPHSGWISVPRDFQPEACETATASVTASSPTACASRSSLRTTLSPANTPVPSYSRSTS